MGLYVELVKVHYTLAFLKLDFIAHLLQKGYESLLRNKVALNCKGMDSSKNKREKCYVF